MTHSTFPGNLGDWPQNNVFRYCLSTCYANANRLNDFYQPRCEGYFFVWYSAVLISRRADDVMREWRHGGLCVTIVSLRLWVAYHTHTLWHTPLVSLVTTNPLSRHSLYRFSLHTPGCFECLGRWHCSVSVRRGLSHVWPTTLVCFTWQYIGYARRYVHPKVTAEAATVIQVNIASNSSRCWI